MTVLAGLARRAAVEPENPWLFYRRGWDWRWRSWGQVADQVARGAGALAQSPALAVPADVRVAFDGRQDPDAVAAGLAVRAAGGIAVPRAEGPLRPLEVTQLEDGGPSVRLRIPACRSRLERWLPRPLEPGSEGALALGPAAPRITAGEIERWAESLEAILPSAAGDRPILCASAAVDSRATQILLAWTVLSGAAWVLEPDVEAFEATALWARPTVVVASGRELDRLAAALRDRRRRRCQRLTAVAAVGGAVGLEAWAELGVPVCVWSA